MTPQKQLYRHDPAAGVWGDCDRATIACLLDLPAVADVPHFHDRGVSSEVADAVKRAWLAKRGYGIWRTVVAGSAPLADVLAMAGHFNPEEYWLLIGQSRNGTGHVVICRGDKIVWDPSLDNSGIVGPDGDYWYMDVLTRRRI